MVKIFISKIWLTLHEKGKSMMNRGEYKDSLIIMELAFESLSQVNQQLLFYVDNYGLLALGIVYIYN